MRKNVKNIFAIAFVLMVAIILTGCGDKTTPSKGKTNKDYAFPTANFIPSGMEYTGSGKIEYSSTNESSNPKVADAYISNATIEDAVAYVQKLKEKGLTNANKYREEQTGFDEYGSFSWVGVNSSETLCISVTLTEDSAPLNLVDGSYNLLITLTDVNIYGE